MIWLTWHQFRAQAVTGAAALAVFAVFAVLLAVTGPHLAILRSRGHRCLPCLACWPPVVRAWWVWLAAAIEHVS